MLIKFVSKASGSILMLGKEALPVLQATGKQLEEDVVPPRGVFTVEQLPSAVANLKKAMQNAVEPEEKEGEDEAGFKLNIVQAVGFKQRAFPLYEMLLEAEKAGVEVMWEPAETPW